MSEKPKCDCANKSTAAIHSSCPLCRTPEEEALDRLRDECAKRNYADSEWTVAADGTVECQKCGCVVLESDSPEVGQA